MKAQPHPRNFCGNGFPDWLEVNLTPECNGKCAWCVERRGWHPKYRAPWERIADAAIATGRKNIILLGGEPTLHPDLGKIVKRIRAADRNPWITTNGSMLSSEWVADNLRGIAGVNISIHNHDLARNERITRIAINEPDLCGAVNQLGAWNARVRFNCNCISGEIDSISQMRDYIRWVGDVGGDSVRFAELKFSDGSFVDIAEVVERKYGTNDNPFADGCNSDAVIDGMPVNFRQMCGMQTRLRPCPENPEIIPHPVLYYDGELYDGWQQRRDGDMTEKQLVELLESVREHRITVAEAAILLDRDQRGEQEKIRRAAPGGGGGCVY